MGEHTTLTLQHEPGHLNVYRALRIELNLNGPYAHTIRSRADLLEALCRHFDETVDQYTPRPDLTFNTDNHVRTTNVRVPSGGMASHWQRRGRMQYLGTPMPNWGNYFRALALHFRDTCGLDLATDFDPIEA